MANNLDLCSTCQLFDLYSFQRDVEQCHGYTVDKVEEGKMAGCRFCGMLYEGFRASHIKQPIIRFSIGRLKNRESTALGVRHIILTLGHGVIHTKQERLDRTQRMLLYVVADPGAYVVHTKACCSC